MVQVNAANSGSESFEKMLSDKAHNKKWINFARKELRKHKNTGSARHMEPEDYVEDIKLKLLTGEIVFVEGNGNADNFICGIIKNEIKTELRKEPGMVTLKDRGDDGDEEISCEENDVKNAQGCAGAEDDENLVVKFEDPFEVKVEEMGNWEVMKICYDLLEKEGPEMVVVFDERAKGHPNREIAKYLNVNVREVENIWKKVVRLLRKEIKV
jgi:DNA-directed RNA polymerase specialized sigma24 family protein